MDARVSRFEVTLVKTYNARVSSSRRNQGQDRWDPSRFYLIFFLFGTRLRLELEDDVKWTLFTEVTYIATA